MMYIFHISYIYICTYKYRKIHKTTYSRMQDDPPTQRVRTAKVRQRKRKRADDEEAGLATADYENQEMIYSNPKTGKARVAETSIPVIWD